MTKKRTKADPEAEANDDLEVTGDVGKNDAVSGATQGELAELGGDEAVGETRSGHDGEPSAGERTSDPDRVVRDSAVASVSGAHVEVSDSVVLSVAAGTVDANDALIVVGTIGKLDGDAKVLFDTRSAMLFGAAVGLVLALLGALLRGGCGGGGDEDDG